MALPSLKKRIILILLVSLIVYIAISFVLIKRITEQFKEDIASRNLSLSKAIAGHVETILQQPQDNLKQLRHQANAWNVNAETGINGELAAFLKSNLLVELVQVLDANGVVSQIAPLDSDFIGLDLSNQQFFILPKDQIKLFWSNSFISSQTKSPSVTMSICFNKGVLVAQLNLKWLSEIINIISRDYKGVIAIVDGRGVIIAHNDKKLSAQSINISNMRAVQMGKASVSGNADDQWKNEKGLSSVSLIRKTGWSVIVFQPDKQALGIVDTIEKTILITLAIVSVLISLILVLPLRRLKASVMDFELQTQLLARGSYTVEIIPEFEEFNSVSNNFNLMAQKIITREDALRKSEEKYRLMIETANEGVCFIDQDDSISFANKRLADMLGDTIDKLKEGKFTDYIFPEDINFFRIKIKQRKQGVKETYETRLLKKNKTELWVLFSAAPIFDEEGKYLGSLGMIVDISERKKHETELAQYRDRLEVLVQERTTELKAEIQQRKTIEKEIRNYAETQEVLLQEVNHRVKNNLFAIISILHKEEERIKFDIEINYPDILRDLIGRIQGLSTVHQLLSAIQWKPLLMQHLCENIIQAALNSMSYRDSVNVSVSSVDVYADSSQSHHLALVLNELATNSIKHGRQDGQSLDIVVVIRQQNDQTHINYSDNGPGFSESIINGDFSRCNIGMQLIRGIVTHSLNGEIRFKNNNGAVTMIILRS
jgi:PAS domain S-box-containing protein